MSMIAMKSRHPIQGGSNYSSYEADWDVLVFEKCVLCTPLAKALVSAAIIESQALLAKMMDKW